MALPITVGTVVRWNDADLQDYSHYFLRAEGIDRAAALLTDT
jgi:hypothetical protein